MSQSRHFIADSHLVQPVGQAEQVLLDKFLQVPRGHSNTQDFDSESKNVPLGHEVHYMLFSMKQVLQFFALQMLLTQRPLSK